MASVKAILLKPLDGLAPGTEREFDQVDFDRLKEMGAVKASGKKMAEAPQNKMAEEPQNKAYRKKGD